MKIIDKIKNFFYDDEEIEVPDFKDKKKRKAETINKDQEKNVSLRIDNEPKLEEVISERELFKADTTFKFPIVFEEEDLSEHQNKRVNVLEMENVKVKSETLTIKERKIFIPSPIYGIIESPTAKKDISKEIENLYSKDGRLNIDTVIDNTYRYADSELKKKNLSKKDKTQKKKEPDLDLFKDLNNLKEEEDKKQSAIDDEVRIKSIDELLESTDEQDFYTLIDSMYENVEEEDSN